MMDALDFILGSSLLTFCSLEDIRHKKIRLIYPVIWGCVGGMLHIAGGQLMSVLIGCLPGLAILGISWATRGAVGMGDGVIVAVMGMFGGFGNSLLSLFWALSAAAIIGCIMMIAGKWGRKKQIPFVPFLWAAYMGVALWN